MKKTIGLGFNNDTNTPSRNLFHFEGKLALRVESSSILLGADRNNFNPRYIKYAAPITFNN